MKLHMNIHRCDSRAAAPHLYTAPGPQAMEDQAVLLLDALVHATHPLHIAELGVWRGHTSLRLANACASVQGQGYTPTLHLVDTDAMALAMAEGHLANAADALQWDNVVPYRTSVEAWEPRVPMNLTVIDADWKNRPAELAVARRHSAPGALIVMHDTGNDSPDRHAIVHAVRASGLATLDLALPRGLMIAQVPW